MVGMEQVLVLFLLIVAGIIIKKKGIVTEHINKEVSSLVINVCLPAFILSSMAFDFSVEVLINSGMLVFLSFTIYGVSIVMAKLLNKALKKQGAARDVYEYIAVFSNCGFMGYPVLHAAFGEEAVFYAAIYNLSFSVLVWSYGVFIMQRSHREDAVKRSVISIIKSSINPAMIAVFIGFALFLTGVKLPGPIFKTVKMIGSATTPLSMMFIGFILAEVHPKELLSDWKDYVLTAHRLVIIPLLVYFGLTAIGVDGITLVIPVVVAAMPAAANSAIIASKYKSDFKLASKLIFITTLLSIVSIPLMIGLVQ
tara:strand:+ start:355 stop:1284 length:930 start_codon:yes stop_codon:yes gene_type:complete